MFDRLLIANRGEIVHRVARSARSLGITSVGVYSEPDRNAPHVEAVDVAVALGGAAPADSYLRSDAIIEIALAQRCDAVHPGYGFLSENAGFAAAVVDAGLIWVGPTADQIAVLGDKIAAKRIAIEAGVPASPVIEATSELDPRGLTYPVLVKAAAGGGGRGMRLVSAPSELAAAVVSASHEAASAFGDGTVFVEPYISGGRHIEVQIMGDQHGNIVHFGERECSIQRRNQKLLEEAPAPSLDPVVRDQLCASALALARHVGYQNAGTVEFIVGSPGRGESTFDLLEVNTRLQVEHRVTEQAWGVDLVALQLRVAAGEPLAVDSIETAAAAGPVGHAIEIRLVAEDPAHDWRPSIGPVGDSFSVTPPADGASVGAGSTITTDYDSLIANIVGTGTDRAQALERLKSRLSLIDVGSLRTNLETMNAILHEPDFLAGHVTTSYLDEHPGVLTAGVVGGETLVAHLIAVVLADEQRNRTGDAVTGFAPSGWRNLRTVGQRRTWMLDGDPHHIEYVIDGDVATVDVGDVGDVVTTRRRLVVRLLARDHARQVVEIDGTRFAVSVELGDHRARSHSTAGSVEWIRPPRFADHDHTAAGGGPVSPLPGTVIAVHVEPGQRVAQGTLLMAVEAMKMEHKIVAAGDATVVAVHFQLGDRVDTGDLLVELDLDDW